MAIYERYEVFTYNTGVSDILWMQLFAPSWRKANRVLKNNVSQVKAGLPYQYITCALETLHEAILRWLCHVWHSGEGTHILLRQCEPIPKTFLHWHHGGWLITHGAQLVPHLRRPHPDDEVVSVEKSFYIRMDDIWKKMDSVFVCDWVIKIPSPPLT